MKMAVQRHKFERLNEDIYEIWASRAKAFFRQRKLWEAIDPGYVVPLGGRLMNRQQNKDDDAKNLLIQLVDDQFLQDVEKCQMAKEGWSVLEAICCDMGMLQIVKCMEELCILKKNNVRMRDYIEHVLKILDKLENS
jgi:hypothetical protein